MTRRAECTVDGCAKPSHARGWCDNHYKKWRKYGDPEGGVCTRHGEPAALIAEAMAERDRSACWLDWPYGHKAGYPMTSACPVSHAVLALDGRPRPAPPGDFALHSCDTPACWNPAHLRWGSQQDNISDMTERDRRASFAGIANGQAKLTEEDVRAIRATTEPVRVVAERYGVGKSLVSVIRRGEAWKHVRS